MICLHGYSNMTYMYGKLIQQVDKFTFNCKGQYELLTMPFIAVTCKLHKYFIAVTCKLNKYFIAVTCKLNKYFIAVTCKLHKY